MKKYNFNFIVLFLFSTIIIQTSCSEDSTSTETDPFANIVYNFWDFKGNGSNSISNSPAWETTNIIFGSSTLLSDGIYENSLEPNPEKAVVVLPDFDISKHSLAINFKVPSSIKNGNWGIKPILVAGRLWRWISIEMNKEGNISITFSGENSFLISDSNLNLNYDSFNTLFLSWDLINKLVKYSLNDSPEKSYPIPTSFNYQNYDLEWTIQHYGNGTAFTGEIDYILDVNEILSKDEMKELIGRLH